MDRGAEAWPCGVKTADRSCPDAAGDWFWDSSEADDRLDAARDQVRRWLLTDQPRAW